MSWQKKPVHLCRDLLNCLVALFVLGIPKAAEVAVPSSRICFLRYFWSRSLLLVDFMPVKNATNFYFCTMENVEENF
ncbi:hypothetical protein ACSBR2_001666 [Camellia fascicularis]